jgi:hypothetical protein
VNYTYHSPSEAGSQRGQLCSLCRAPISPAHLLCGSCQGGDKLQAEVVRLRQLVEAAYSEGFSEGCGGLYCPDYAWYASEAKRRLEG